MKMKKSFSFIMVTTIVFAFLVAGCKFSNDVDTQRLKDNENATKWSNLTQNRPQIAKEFDSVGADHNKMLGEVYNELVSFKDAQIRAVSDKKGLSDEDISFVINRYFSGTKVRAAVTENSEDIESAPEFTFSPAAQKFIDRIKVLIDPITVETPQHEVAEVLKQIEGIEQEAEAIVLPEEKNPFYAYTATSRASLAYWYDNIKDWDNLRENNAQAGRYISIWRRLKACVASDAAGAAVGAAMGAAIGSGIPGVGTVVGAAVGAVVVGGASSATGWATGNFSIVVPITDLNRRVEQGR